MKDKDIALHYNKMDITQRLLADNMRGQKPLITFDFETAKVQEVLPTDLPDLRTKDDKADTLYLLEDGTFLHVEYQTTVRKHDPLRFAEYVLGLYNKYKDDERFESFEFQTVVMYAPHISRSSVKTTLDLKCIQFTFHPLLLNELDQSAEYTRIIDKIRQDPNVVLTDEEKMLLIYKPLFHSQVEDIENEAIQVVRDIQEISDPLLKTRLIGTIFVLTMKYLGENGQNKIWEVLKDMNIVQEEMKKQYEQGYDDMRRNIRQKILLAIKEDRSDEWIQELIDLGRFTKEEVAEIYAEAKK
ncbi:hypothetical protein SMD22_00980 (plasmid) [Brevibacillus halotolerans]|nr:hypothetical protein SMD22_00980 [Brevibacillus halotolerans]